MIETKDPEELVKAQLEEWATTDAALAEKFKPEKVGSCWRWIVEKAREALHGQPGAIWHEQVFRWARDYFVDGEAEKDATATAKPKKRTARKATPAPAVKAETPSPAPALQQLDLFGGVG